MIRRKLIFILFFFLLTLSGQTNAQILANANLNLNPGGYINDVAYSEYHDAYVVVGNFTSIGGYSRKNIAFIDRATLLVETASYMVPISNIDGEIKTVEIIKTFSYGIPNVDSCHLYIGGSFGTVTIGATNYTRNGIAKLVSKRPYILPITTTNFVMHSWNPDLDMDPGYPEPFCEGVTDIVSIGDSILFCGGFLDLHFDIYQCLALYSNTTGAPLVFPAAAGTFTWADDFLYKICLTDDLIFVTGTKSGSNWNYLIKMDYFGNTFNYTQFYFETPQLNGITDIYELDDSLLLVLESSHSTFDGPDDIVICRQSDGSLKTDHYLTPSGSEFIAAGTLSSKTSMVTYNDKLYVGSGVTNNSLMSFELGNSSVSQPAPVYWNSGNTTPFPVYYFGNTHVARNRLFVSSSNLTLVGGQSRIGLGIYCLEPENPQGFTQYSSTVCPLDVDTFTIPTSQFAEGYRWEYTGNFLDLGNNGTFDTGPIDFDASNANSVVVKFGEFATSGTLTVTPYSYCNGTTKVFAKSQSVIISVKSIPNVNAGIDTAITCHNFNTGIELFGYSDSLNVVDYLWDYGNDLLNVSGQIDTVENAGNYIFKVTNIFGCANYDTVYVGLDTISPNATLPVGPNMLTCDNPQITLLGSSTTSNTIINWAYAGDSTLLNPYTTSGLGNHALIVVDTINGCEKILNLFVAGDFVSPNISFLEYPVFTSGTLDTLTCYNDSITVNAYSTSSNATVEWTTQDTSAFFGSSLNITTPGFYYLFATDADNGCTDYKVINVDANFATPQSVAPVSALINCSVDSVELIGSTINNFVTTEWFDGTTTSTQNPIIAYNSGWYYFTVTDTTNGCSATDSVEVMQDNSINVDAGNDQLICDKELVTLNVNYIGNFTTISYSWNNGSTNASATYEGGTNSEATVIVYGDGGCVGHDTVSINLPPYGVATFQGFKPCDGGATGQIVITPVSGATPFEYSIDNGNTFQSSPVFTNLIVGNYNFVVRDSVGCDYFYSASITENSAVPEADFLFSTYNFESDTVVLIDISNPPADSVDWMIPLELIWLNEGDEIPFILLPDTGTFSIGMRAYFGSCQVDVNKLIYASAYDSLNATTYNANGIKSVLLYPNPTTGIFTVEVEFYKSQRCKVYVQDMIGNTYFTDEFEESTIIQIPVELDDNAMDGTYLLKVIAEFDSKYITFILAR